MKKAFTMIELIFIIVIIGILSAIAFPKLMATRNNAKAATDLHYIATCINNVASYYTSQGEESTVDIGPCQKIKCANVILDDVNDGIITVELLDSNATGLNYCDEVKERGLKKDFNGTHKFSGSKIKID